MFVCVFLFVYLYICHLSLCMFQKYFFMRDLVVCRLYIAAEFVCLCVCTAFGLNVSTCVIAT